jgi:predicted nuclease with RNAse H fold
MLIAGLDLAAEPKGTAFAVLDWSNSRAKIVSLKTGVNDQDVLDASSSLDKIGIDCALGWPVCFVEFVGNYSQKSLAGTTFDGGIDWRRKLAYRETDREVRLLTGRWPLSVSTDRLGMTAMRCAGLLSKLQAAGVHIDRSGQGKVVEIYPAASMRIWGFQFAGYRNSPSIRRDLIGQLATAAPWLELSTFAELMIESCDAFDAVIAAISASSAAFGQSTSPPADKLAAAQIEGWVALPLGTLASLRSRLG